MSYGERSDTRTVGRTACMAFTSAACWGYEKRSADPTTHTSAVRAAFKHGSVALAALWLGVVGLRMVAKATRDESRRERPRMTGPVVVTGAGQS